MHSILPSLVNDRLLTTLATLAAAIRQQFSLFTTPPASERDAGRTRMTTHPSTPHQSARQQASTLNRQQRAAVHFVDGPLLVLAGAGSGKTSVITRKIAWLVEGCGIPARHIAAVTFTNKAAREMKQRVGQLLQGRDGRGLTVCTFHRLGLDIIQRELANVGRKRGFSIFDEQDAKALLSYGDAPGNGTFDAPEMAALTQLCVTLLASDSAILLY